MGLPAHEVGPRQVGLHHCVPAFQCHVGGSTRKLPSAVVHQEIQPPELVESELVQRLHVLLPPDVAPQALHGAELPHLGRCSRHLLLAPGGDHHPGAQTEKLLCDGLPYASPAT